MKWSDVLYEIAVAPVQSVQWRVRAEKQWAGSFQIGERQIEIFFARLSSFGTTRWRVDFRKGQQQPTGGTVAETTGTLNDVIGAIKEFLETVKPDRLEMSPTNTSREKLYRAVIKRMMPQIGQAYSVEEKSYGTLFGEFILSRHTRMTEAAPPNLSRWMAEPFPMLASRRAKKINEGATIKLTDLYDEDELSDPREQLHSYVDENDLQKDFVVHEMTPAQALTYVTPRDDMTVYQAFRQFAGKEQKRFVRERAKNFDHSRIIVTINNTVLDGNHHLVVGILAKQSIKFINLAE
jgi:hypothetical protein